MILAAAAFLFAYFLDNGQTGVYFAISEDGYRYSTLNAGKAWIPPQHQGELMRDPYIARGPDGQFHMVWTWDWKGQQFGYASSSDLVTWSDQRIVPVPLKSSNVWAPEICWDPERKDWIVIWSSTIPGMFSETAHEQKNGLNHRIWSMTTKDFVTFSQPKVFFDPGYSVIDATIVRDEKTWRMIFKDERDTPVKKFLLMAEAQSPSGPWTVAGKPFTESWREGPSALQVGKDWLVYFDHYRTPQRYEVMRTRDFKNFEDVTAKLSMPPGVKHGSFLALSAEEAARLKGK